MEPTLIPPGPLVALDYLGIAVFAISGALVAAEKKQTLVTFIFFAVITGVGGGTHERAKRRVGLQCWAELQKIVEAHLASPEAERSELRVC